MDDGEANQLLQAALAELKVPKGEEPTDEELEQKAVRAGAVMVQLIDGDIEAAHRAVQLLFALQTTEERRRSTTLVRNGVGFDAYDASRGSALAKKDFADFSEEERTDASRIAKKHATQARR